MNVEVNTGTEVKAYKGRNVEFNIATNGTLEIKKNGALVAVYAQWASIAIA